MTVRDDGAGFDTDGGTDAGEGNGMRVGMKNVRGRLWMQCRATMEVQSRPGEGTVVTLRFPVDDNRGAVF